MFSAALRMAAHIPRKVRVAFVEEVRLFWLIGHCSWAPHASGSKCLSVIP